MPGAQEAQIYECPSPGTDKAGKRQPRGFSQGELATTSLEFEFHLQIFLLLFMDGFLLGFWLRNAPLVKV